MQNEHFHKYWKIGHTDPICRNFVDLPINHLQPQFQQNWPSSLRLTVKNKVTNVMTTIFVK